METMTQYAVTDWLPQAAEVNYKWLICLARFIDQVTQVISNKYLSPCPAFTTLQCPGRALATGVIHWLKVHWR